MKIPLHEQEHQSLGRDALSSYQLSKLFDLMGARKVTISGVTGAGEGYQVPLAIDTTTMPNDGINIGFVAARQSAVNDSGSIRIYSEGGALLPTYVDENLTYWVRIAANLDTDQVIYVLDNGDVAAANVSNGDAVFELYDQFEVASINTSKWAVSGGTPTFAGPASNKYALMTGADAAFSLKSVASFGDGYEVVVRGRFPNASADGHGMIVGFDGQYSYYNKQNTVLSYIAKGALGADEVSQGSRIAGTSDVLVSVGRAGGVGRVKGANQVAIDVTTNSSGVSTATAPLYINNVYAAGTSARVTSVFVRKWVGVAEPTVASSSGPAVVHNHALDVLTPLDVLATGVIKAFQRGAQFGDFAYNADVGEDADNHGVVINVRPTAPGTTNYIGNVRFSVNGTPRWTLKKTEAVESGSNAGSNFELLPSSDAGSALSSLAFTWSRDGRFSCPSVPPAAANSAGRAGTIQWDANYIYVCVATNTWKRVAIATW